MIELADELRRLTSASSQVAFPSERLFIEEIDVCCPGDAATVLARMRELLTPVMRYRIENPPDEKNEPAEFTIDKAYWSTVLPGWFLTATPFDSGTMRTEGWTVEGWLYWFLSPYEERCWRWISASVVSPAQLKVTIEVDGLPFPWDALRWSLLAAGATEARLPF